MTPKTRIILVALLAVFLAALPGGAALAQSGDQVCFKAIKNLYNLDQCFERSHMFPMPVGVYTQDASGNAVPVPNVEVRYVNFYGEAVYDIGSCVTGTNGRCEITVPDNGSGAITIQSNNPALRIDPSGYARAVDVQDQMIATLEASGLEGKSQSFENRDYPYAFETSRDTTVLAMVEPSTGKEAYPYHWLLYTKEGEDASFVRNQMAEFAPSVEKIAPTFDMTANGKIQSAAAPAVAAATAEAQGTIPTKSPDEKQNEPDAKDGQNFPVILVVIILAVLLAAGVTIAIRMRLSLREQ
jgi:hypothetical protein